MSGCADLSDEGQADRREFRRNAEYKSKVQYDMLFVSCDACFSKKELLLLVYRYYYSKYGSTVLVIAKTESG